MQDKYFCIYNPVNWFDTVSYGNLSKSAYKYKAIVLIPFVYFFIFLPLLGLLFG